MLNYQATRHQLDMLRDQGLQPNLGMQLVRELQLRLGMRHCQVMHQVLLQLDTLHSLEVQLRQDTLRELALHLRLDTRHCQVMHQVLLHLDTQLNQVARLKRATQHNQGLRLNLVMQRYLELHQHLQVEQVSIQQGLSRVEHSGQLVILQEAHSPAGHSLVMDQD